jgi:myo-inositol 2-dehydrogenase/D-chiro-inositol 1-dehydrogenase
MADLIRVAFIGAGRMGLTHLRNLGGIADVRVVVVADPNIKAAERGRQFSRAERATSDIGAAINDPTVDAVVIATPTHTHAQLIALAAQAGKAIWCEKPIALDLAETQRVVDVVKAAGVSVQLGFMRRFDPGYVAAKRRIDAGELGRIETFRALSRDTYPPPLEFLITSGGIFLDMAVHDLDLARFLVGEVDEVQAWGGVLADARFAQADDCDTAVAMLRFVNGALGVVETARHSAWGYDIRTEVAGAVGKIVVEATQKTPLTFSRAFGYEGDHFESFPDRFEAAYRLELEAFFTALRDGRRPSPGPEDALETLRLALAATRSWREGRPVKISEITP